MTSCYDVRHDGFEPPPPSRRAAAATSTRLAGRHRLRRPGGSGDVSPTRRCWPTPSTSTATRSYGCGSVTWRPARTWPTGRRGRHHGGAWTADSSCFFYLVHDELWRPHQVWRHRLGTPAGDGRAGDGGAGRAVRGRDLRRARTGDLVVIWSREPRHQRGLGRSTPTTPTLGPALRRRAAATGSSYHAEHRGRRTAPDELLLVTNDGRPSSGWRRARCRARPTRTRRPGCRCARGPRRAAQRVRRVRRATSCSPRAPTARNLLRILPLDDLAGDGHRRRRPVSTIASRVGAGRAQRRVRRATGSSSCDESYLMPAGVVATVDLATGERTERLPQGGARASTPTSYVGGAADVPVADGTLVPATIVRHRDTPLDGTAPCLVVRLRRLRVGLRAGVRRRLPSLLDQGVVFANAHIRGGGEGGRRWWLDGRMEHKQNTFTDHIAVADFLRRRSGRRRPDRDPRPVGRRPAAGCSVQPGAATAGRGVIAEVPFVDVVTTMLDGSIPLTINEWDEWGDPSRAERLRVAEGLLAVRQPAAGRHPPRPARHRRPARPAGDGVGAGEVGGHVARQRPGVVAALLVPRRDRRRCPRRAVRPVRPRRLRGRDLRLDPRPAREPARRVRVARTT